MDILTSDMQGYNMGTYFGGFLIMTISRAYSEHYGPCNRLALNPSPDFSRPWVESAFRDSVAGEVSAPGSSPNNSAFLLQGLGFRV